jgi:hypothetical protein
VNQGFAGCDGCQSSTVAPNGLGAPDGATVGSGDELGCQLRNPFGLALGRKPKVRNVLALDISELAHTLLESSELWYARVEKLDEGNGIPGCAGDSKRQRCRRSTECRDKFSPPHVRPKTQRVTSYRLVRRLD